MEKLFFEKENFDIALFSKVLDGVHATLYDYFSTPEELILKGESLIKDELLKPLVKQLYKFKEDVFTSDRELAAFAITYDIFSRK